ncbi:group III truncated hemoglobin [Dyadobacter sp. CY345]|uniref:group III truncated hemoglobin n=1 Tax=Dyadobacter sp. CY345 TaxID=2909335 RepID=UPI001F39C48F|nr:group III truncated hemoglobin [Dyadobacter sp. CY345]MCF2446563.1 group III truncated hemoglobin [Dyadobacter sp. CY345]
METKKEIVSLEEVKLLVDTFYDKVRSDAKLAPIFEARIKGNWEPHLEKMYKFWQTILLSEMTYTGNPFQQHERLPVDYSHFAAWMTLFTETIDELFTGDKSEEAKRRAGKIAETFEHKIAHYQKNMIE